MSPAELSELTAPLVGAGGRAEVLKDKPGRRRTSRVVGRHATVVCKQYTSGRARTVADRLAALAVGPASPRLPRVIALHADQDLVVISHLSGSPLGQAVDAGRLAAVRDAGAAIGRWHRAWEGRQVDLAVHGVDRERTILAQWADRSAPSLRRRVERAAGTIDPSWPISTVVHRDLYEEQVLVAPGPSVGPVHGAPGDVGLVDLDDAARGPAELDLGNLVAHLLLRSGDSTTGHRVAATLLAGHHDAGATLDADRLADCLRLSLLRLACIHDRPDLVDLADGWNWQQHRLELPT